MDDHYEDFDERPFLRRFSLGAGACVAAALTGMVWSNLLSGERHPAGPDYAGSYTAPVPRARPAQAGQAGNMFPSSRVEVAVRSQRQQSLPADDPLGALIISTARPEGRMRARAGTPQPVPDAQSLVFQAQKLLRDLGYYEGEIDGRAGPMTREAVEKYQVFNGLAVTGIVTVPVLEHLQMQAKMEEVSSLLAPPEPEPFFGVEDVRLVQIALSELGYMPGRLNGRLTYETHQAILAFEADRGMAQTGQVSRRLMNELTKMTGVASITD